MTLTNRSLVLGSLIALANSCFAQIGPGAKCMTAMMPEVQREIHLTKQQRKAINDAMTSVSKQAQADPSSMMGGSGDMMSGINDKLDAQALATLGEGQRQRLDELWLQYEGPPVWTSKPVADKLGLSDDQRKKVEDVISKCNQNEMDAMMNSTKGLSAAKHAKADMEKIAKQRNEDLLALLTPEQTKTWDEMKGKPFKFKMPKST